MLPFTQVWKDWVAILALYLLGRALAPAARGWPAWTLATVTALLAIYIYGQLPYTLLSLGGGP